MWNNPIFHPTFMLVNRSLDYVKYFSSVYMSRQIESHHHVNGYGNVTHNYTTPPSYRLPVPIGSVNLKMVGIQLPGGPVNGSTTVFLIVNEKCRVSSIGYWSPNKLNQRKSYSRGENEIQLRSLYMHNSMNIICYIYNTEIMSSTTPNIGVY